MVVLMFFLVPLFLGFAVTLVALSPKDTRIIEMQQVVVNVQKAVVRVDFEDNSLMNRTFEGDAWLTPPTNVNVGPKQEVDLITATQLAEQWIEGLSLTKPVWDGPIAYFAPIKRAAIISVHEKFMSFDVPVIKKGS